MDYEELGKQWLRGEAFISEFQGIEFNEKQSAHLNGKKRFELISGGMACVHADTLIDTPKGKIKAKDFKGGLVYSKEGLALALKSKKYKKTNLFKVTTTTGSFVGTKDHRVWSLSGWKRLGTLKPSEYLPLSEPYLQESSLDNALLGFSSNGPHSYEINAGSPFYCRLLHRLYGLLPQSVKDTFPKLLPSQVYVPEHTQLYSNEDAQVFLPVRNRLYRWFYHLSKIDSFRQAVHQLLNEANRNVIKVFERTSHSSPLLLQFRLKTYRVLRMVLKALYNFSSPYSNPTTKIVSIQEVESDNYYDLHVFGTNNYSAEGLYHHNSGKTVAWDVKFILLHMFFPGMPSLIGRKTKGNAISTFMEAFTEICPPELYNYKAGEGKIEFVNGSSATFFGLDALQGGSGEDTKKAQQYLKSHTFGTVWIDQLEEIEKRVFDALNSRMRWRPCKHSKNMQEIHFEKGGKIMAPLYTEKIAKIEDSQKFHAQHGYPLFQICNECGKYSFNQMNFTTNPANFWGYKYFKSNPEPMTNLIETSMLDNRENLGEAFIQSELNKPKRYVQKYVYGEWSPDSLVEGGVFPEESIKAQEMHVQKPKRTLDGIEIFEEPKQARYQIGIDPSEGATDPCHIKVVCIDSGEEVANFSGFVPLAVISEKAIQLAYMYSTTQKPLIVCEAQGGGQAVIEQLKKNYDNIYEREVFNHREKKYTKKLGFHTNHATKALLIDHQAELFRKGYAKIRDEKTVEELKVFIYSDEAKLKGAGAQSGYHDDKIMATMLAYWGLESVSRREKSLLDRVTRQKRKSKVQYQYN